MATRSIKPATITPAALDDSDVDSETEMESDSDTEDDESLIEEDERDCDDCLLQRCLLKTGNSFCRSCRDKVCLDCAQRQFETNEVEAHCPANQEACSRTVGGRYKAAMQSCFCTPAAICEWCSTRVCPHCVILQAETGTADARCDTTSSKCETTISGRYSRACSFGLVVGGNTWTLLNDPVAIDCRLALRSQPKSPLVIWSTDSVRRSKIEYFDRMWPTRAFDEWVIATNLNLSSLNHEPTDVEELRKFIAVVLLMCVHQKPDRRDYWRTKSVDQDLFPSFDLGEKVAMSRDRFEEILSCLAFRLPVEGCTNPWYQIDCLIDDFHAARESCYSPGDVLVIDESFSKWLGLEGQQKGIPHCTKNAHKPTGVGAEAIVLCDGTTNIALRIELSKGKEHNAATNNGVPFGAAVTARLTDCYKGSARLVVGDSRFASMSTVKLLRKQGLFFTGLVKTAYAGFPKTWLKSGKPYVYRGETRALSSQDQILAVGWFDCPLRSSAEKKQRRTKCFVSSAGTTLDGKPHVKKPSGEIVPRCCLVEDYFKAAAAVDQHNRLRQHELAAESAIGTQSWSTRVAMTIFGMMTVDAFLAYKHERAQISSIQDFVTELVVEMLPMETRRKRMQTSDATHQLLPLRMHADFTEISAKRVQRRCVRCNNRASFFCSGCSTEKKTIFLCGFKTRRTCFLDFCKESAKRQRT